MNPEELPSALLPGVLLAIDPLPLGGALIRGPAGSARDAWLAVLRALAPPGMPCRRIPPGIADGRLLGDLDVAATLAHGRQVLEKGLLEEAAGGLMVLPMAERRPRRTIGHLAAALDASQVAVIALDESEPGDAALPDLLVDRLALLVDLWGDPSSAAIPAALAADDVIRARACLGRVSPHPEGAEYCCAMAAMLGVSSLRRPLFCLKAAAALAALAGRHVVDETDLARAAELVLAPFATVSVAPATPSDRHAAQPLGEPDEPRGREDEEGAGAPKAMADRIVSAAEAKLPVLAKVGVSRGSRGREGRQEARQGTGDHGRSIGSCARDDRSAVRLHLVDTLRAALPWQRVRGRRYRPGEPVAFRSSDLRVHRLQRRHGVTVILVVDASGSSAMHRLGEAKGAAELLLARSYVRRDQVAVVTFRGAEASVMLPPTRAVARARRCLAALPGGGGTPLAHAIDVSRDLGERVRREGGTPQVVFLTDAQANVARDGLGGRARARDDALQAAKRLAAAGLSAVLIDTSPRPNPFAAQCAGSMRASLVRLPSAGAEALHAAIEGVVAQVRTA